MNKAITVGYVEGYADAVKSIHQKTNESLERNGSNVLVILNEVIFDMHKQKTKVLELQEQLKMQEVESEPAFEDCCDEECCYGCASEGTCPEEERNIRNKQAEKLLTVACAIESAEKAVDALGANSYTLTFRKANEGGM